MRDEIRQQAAVWVARLDAGASPDDLEAIAQWVAADPLHKNALLEMASLWDRMGVLSELSNLFPLGGYVPAPSRRARAKAWVAVAAGLLLAVLAAGGFWLSQTGSEPPGTAEIRVYETSIGEQSHISLPDGSVVQLNTDTRIDVDYSEEAREVILRRGEGHFTVVPQGRPFRVQAGRRVIEAVGTSFNVYMAAAGDLQVTVTEGRVRLLRVADPVGVNSATSARRSDSSAVVGPVLSLDAGQHAAVREFAQDVETRQMQLQDIEARLAWRQGYLLFHGDPLSVVLQEVSRYTRARIEADPGIRDTVVSGYFRAGDIDGLLVAMQENFQIDARREGDDRIVLTPRP